MTEPSHPLFLLGAGYSARALAKVWPGPVMASARSKEAMVQCQAAGIRPLHIDDLPALKTASRGAHWVISAPPDQVGCPVFKRLGEAAKDAASITYLSTTGVYGDLEGRWAFEWSKTAPGSSRAQRRVTAEEQWCLTRPDLKIARLPGIYGPGRSMLDRLRTGKARRVVKPGHVFSRIHVDDLAEGLRRLVLSVHSGVFHFCDDTPCPPQDVVSFGAEILGVEPPPEVSFDDANLSEMGRSFYRECKRVSNARAKSALSWTPIYPDYKSGLLAILKDEKA